MKFFRLLRLSSVIDEYKGIKESDECKHYFKFAIRSIILSILLTIISFGVPFLMKLINGSVGAVTVGAILLAVVGFLMMCFLFWQIVYLTLQFKLNSKPFCYVAAFCVLGSIVGAVLICVLFVV